MKKETLTVDLDPLLLARLEAAHARVESAQNLLAARKAELDNLFLRVQQHYEENGKYLVTEIRTAPPKVERLLAEQRSAASSEGDRPKS